MAGEAGRSTVRHVTRGREVSRAGTGAHLLLPLVGAALIVLFLLAVPTLDWGVLLTAAITIMSVSIGTGVRQWLRERPR